MKKLRMSLMVLTMIVSFGLGTVAMAEARNRHSDYNDNYYSRNYNNYDRYNKPHRVHYVRPYPARHYAEPPHRARHYVKPHPARYATHHRADYVKHHRRHHDHNRYLYPALIGAGIGLLVLGLAH